MTMSEKKPLATITYAEVREKAREAFLKGELQCQREPAAGCTYSGPCAIGAALSPEVRAALDEQGEVLIGSLLYQGLVKAPAEEWDALRDLQEAHDCADLSRLRDLLDIPDAALKSAQGE